MLDREKSVIGVLLLLSSMLTMMSGAIIAPSLPAISNYFHSTPNSEFLTKIVLTTPAFVITFTAPFVGALSRRTGKIRLLLSAYILYAISGSIGLYVDTLYAILAGRMFFGLSVAVILTITTTLIGDYFSGAQRSKFISIQGSFVSIGGIVFISFAGFLADLSWRYPFAMYLFPLLFFVPALKYLYEPDISSEESPKDSGGKVKKLSNYVVGYIYILGFLGMVLFYLIPVHLPFLIVNELGESASTTGIAIAIMSVSGATISWFYKNIKARFGFFQIFFSSFFLMGIGFIVITLAPTIVILIFGLIISGYGLGLLIPNSNLFFIDNASPARRTSLLGGLSSAFFIGQFLSTVLSDPVFRSTGTQAGFLYFAISSFIISILVMVILQVRKNK